MNKKAAYGIMVGFILAVIIFIIFLSSFDIISFIMNSATDDIICTWSAAANSFRVRETETVIDLKCPVKNMFIRYIDGELAFYKKGKQETIAIPKPYIDKVEEWNNGTYNFTKNEDVQRYKFNTFIARELINCKNKLGGGNLDLFDSDLFGGKSACVICSRIIMDGDELKSFRDEVNDGNNYYSIPGEFFISNPYTFENLIDTKSLWEELKLPTSSDFLNEYIIELKENTLIYYLVQKDAANLRDVLPFFGKTPNKELDHSVLVSNPQVLANQCTVVVN